MANAGVSALSHGDEVLELGGKVVFLFDLALSGHVNRVFDLVEIALVFEIGQLFRFPLVEFGNREVIVHFLRHFEADDRIPKHG
jgi:hypothetical protein